MVKALKLDSIPKSSPKDPWELSIAAKKLKRQSPIAKNLDDDFLVKIHKDDQSSKTYVIDRLCDFQKKHNLPYITYTLDGDNLKLSRPNLLSNLFAMPNRGEEVNFWSHRIKGTNLDVYFHASKRKHVTAHDIHKSKLAIQAAYDRYTHAVMKCLSPKNQKVFKAYLKQKQGKIHFLNGPNLRNMFLKNVGVKVIKEANHLYSASDQKYDGLSHLEDGTNVVYTSGCFPESSKKENNLDHELAHLLVGEILNDIELRKAIAFYPCARKKFTGEMKYLKAESQEDKHSHMIDFSDALIEDLIRVPVKSDFVGESFLGNIQDDFPRHEDAMAEDLLMLAFCGQEPSVKDKHTKHIFDQSIIILSKAEKTQISDDEVIDSAICVVYQMADLNKLIEVFGDFLKERLQASSNENLLEKLSELNQSRKYWVNQEIIDRHLFLGSSSNSQKAL